MHLWAPLRGLYTVKQFVKPGCPTFLSNGLKRCQSNQTYIRLQSLTQCDSHCLWSKDMKRYWGLAFDACSHMQMVYGWMKPRPQKSGSIRLSSNRLTNVFDKQIPRAHVQTSLQTRVCQTEFDKPFDCVKAPLQHIEGTASKMTVTV